MKISGETTGRSGDRGLLYHRRNDRTTRTQPRPRRRCPLPWPAIVGEFAAAVARSFDATALIVLGGDDRLPTEPTGGPRRIALSGTPVEAIASSGDVRDRLRREIEQAAPGTDPGSTLRASLPLLIDPVGDARSLDGHL